MTRTDLDIAIGIHSDLHKDVFGVRPRNLNWTGATIGEVEEATRQIEAMLIAEQADYQSEVEFQADHAESEARWAAFTGVES